jgi:hypothetical protein
MLRIRGILHPSSNRDDTDSREIPFTTIETVTGSITDAASGEHPVSGVYQRKEYRAPRASTAVSGRDNGAAGSDLGWMYH